jgi:myo-inositol-1(or 4)-monophosphatase
MNYLEFLETELRKAAITALSLSGKVKPTTKPGDNNQVLTEADLAIGEQLVSAVRAQYPTHNVVDEEAGAIKNGSEYTWVIDPVEATSNFAAGLADYGIMVGLLHGRTPIAGGIIVPAHGRLYLAEKGKGATCNGKSIHAGEETDLTKVLVSFGIDSHGDNPDLTIRECRLLADVVLGCRNIRNSGCEAVDPMMVAEGRLGGRVNLASKIWDNVGPQIIAEEAGVVWTGIDGAPLDYADPTQKLDQNYAYIAAPQALHSALLRITKPYAPEILAQ